MYFCGMFVRKKPNRSGSTSVVVVEARNSKVCYLKNFGTSSEAKEIEELFFQGKKWMEDQLGQRDLFLEYARKVEEREVVENLLSKVENILINGTQMILNPVFDNIGFNSIDDGILRHLVVSRICHPQSKVATVDYLKSYFDEDVDLNKIHRYLDELSDAQKDKIQEISVEHTRKVLGGRTGAVFYDVTTLYFETDFPTICLKQAFQKTVNMLNLK
jgi:hypothetical protein